MKKKISSSNQLYGILVIAIIISLLIGFGAGKMYAQNVSSNQSKALNFNVAPSVDTETWSQTEIISPPLLGARTNTENALVKIQHPADWTVAEIYENNCLTIELSNATIGSIIMKPNCTGWSATYYPLPADSIIVRTDTYEVSGKPKYTVRFRASGNNNYKYADADLGNTILSSKLSDKAGIGKRVFDINFIPSSLEILSDEKLAVVDTIIASLDVTYSSR